MAATVQQRAFEEIWEKVEAGERLDFEDGVRLMESEDILELGELADAARRRRGGTDDVYFVQNLYLNQTNVCRVKCKFCAFARTQKQEGAYTYTPDELVEDALRQRELTGFTEIHMVGGESPHVGFDYYVDIIRRLHEAMPDVHLKCFTASEIHHMTKLSGLTHEQVLVELKAAARRTRSGSRRTARSSTATSRRTRSGSTISSVCATCRTRRPASSRSSRSPSTPRTPSSSGAAGGTRRARTT